MHTRIAPANAFMVLQDWNDVRFFLAAARSKSFLAAADVLGTTQPTVSRRIALLERRIGTPLFRRTRRGAELTEAGEAILRIAEKVENAATEFDRQLASLDQSVSGTVTVAAGEGIISYILLGEMAELQNNFPELSIRFITAGGLSPAADINIVTLAPEDRLQTRSSLIVTRLGRMSLMAHAAISYLNSNGLPRNIDELRDHRLVDHSTYQEDRGLTPWNELIRDRASRRGCAVAFFDNTSTLHRAIRTGMGIGLLPTYAKHIDGDLVPIPVGFPQMPIDLWLTAHEDSLRSPSVRTVFDFVVAVFRRKAGWFRDRNFKLDWDALDLLE